MAQISRLSPHGMRLSLAAKRFLPLPRKPSSASQQPVIFEGGCWLPQQSVSNPSPASSLSATSDSFAAEPRGNEIKGFKSFYLKAKARIWSRLSFMCHIRSTAKLICITNSFDIHLALLVRFLQAKETPIRDEGENSLEELDTHVPDTTFPARLT